MITAVQFYQAWLDVVEKNHLQINMLWDSPRKYTKLVIHDNESLIMQVSKKLELSCYNGDYYNIDSVLYRNKDWLSQYGGTYLRHICVAFEHENSFFSGLYQEVSHLLITKSELNVLVTYPDSFIDESTLKELKSIHDIILESPYADEISHNNSFLLILADNNQNGAKHSWKGLVFTKERWQEITDII